MSNQGKSKQILVDLAKKILNENSDKNFDSNPEESNTQEETIEYKDISPFTYDMLAKKKGEQTLAERKKLLDILHHLFSIQLIAMNIIVFLAIIWCIFDFPYLKSINQDSLNNIVGLIKFYVGAVLAELLSGIIYIVKKVFSDKTIEKLASENKK